MKENEFFKTKIQLQFTVSFKLWVKIRYVLRKVPQLLNKQLWPQQETRLLQAHTRTPLRPAVIPAAGL